MKKWHASTIAMAASLTSLSPGLALAQGGIGQGDVPPPQTPLDRFGPLGSQQVQLSAGTEDDAASVALELMRWRIAPASGGSVSRATDTLNVIVSTPMNGGDEAQPATLDGLANGTRLTLRGGRWQTYAARTHSPEADRIYQRAQTVCRDEANAIHERRLAELVQPTPPDALAAVEALHRADLKECDDPAGGSGNLIAEHLPGEERRYQALLRPADARQFGFEVSVGRNRFEFLDPATLAEDSERHLQWSARGFYTQYLRGSPTAVTFSAGYERTYEAADEETFCPANPNNVPIRCITARGAAPELNESFLLSAGIRHQFTRAGRVLNLAIAPQVTYDVIDDVFGVDVPVYFLPNSDGGLTGGVRFGYRSDRENEFSVGVFIGAAFNILN